MNTDTVIFDFDYTLGDSSEGIILSVEHALSKLGYAKADHEQIRRTIGSSMKDTLSALTGEDDPEKAGLFSKYFKEKADEVMVSHTVLYDGAKEVLSELKKKGYHTAIVTTKYHYRIDQILKRYNCADLIDHIIGAEDVRIEKPDPEGILRVIRELGTEKDRTVYVGDHLIDAKTAENAGVRFIAVLSGKTPKEEFLTYPNTGICNTIQEVFQCISEQEE